MDAVVSQLRAPQDQAGPADEVFTAERLLALDLLSESHGLEYNHEGSFAWTRPRFRLWPQRAARFLRLRFAYLASRGTLSVMRRGEIIARLALRAGWQEVALALADDDWLDMIVDPALPVAGDTRALGVMLSTMTLSDDAARHAMIEAVAANAARNHQEYAAGATVLASTPPNLRISLETRCNLPETGQPCTYCAWDHAKQMEKGSPPFRLETLDQLGEFYRKTTEIVDCSIGEPTMNRQFPEILLRFERDGKPLSFTSNGQLLVERRRRELLGKDVTLYISVDAATAAGFRRYRNDRFDTILANLRALCAEKRAHGNRPLVFVSFIAMRSNHAELPAFFALMKDIGVDEIKIRTLYLGEGIRVDVANNGYLFDYEAETLSQQELAALSPAIRQLADTHAVRTYIDWDEFEAPEQHAPGEPICAEPWKTLYVLNRGILPCCYARQPLATWQEQGERSLDDFLGDVFNSRAYQTIRSELAAGRLPQYCCDTPSCPLLKRGA